MNFTTIQQPLVEALGWTLLHSLWQGLIIATILALTIRFIKNKSPQLIYQLCCLSLLGLVAWMASTFFHHFHWPIANELELTGFLTNGMGDDISFIAGSLSWQESIDIFLQSFIHSYADELVMLWLLGVTLFGLKWGGTLYFTYSLKNQNISTASVAWQNTVQEFSQKLGIKKPIAIYQSSKIDVPMVIGYLKPVILMPASIVSGFSSEQIESIIVHELAHIKSNDFLIGLILSAMEVVLFYHPMYWWISGIIMEEREKCCDDIAVAQCGNPLLYARTLFTIAEQKQQRSLALSLQGKKNQLFDRIKRVCISPQGNMKSNNNKAGMALGLLFVMAIMAMAQVPTEAKEAFIDPVKEAIIDQFQLDADESETNFEWYTKEESGDEEELKAEETDRFQMDTIPLKSAKGKTKTLVTKLDQDGNISIIKKDIDGELHSYFIRKGEADIFIDDQKLEPGNHKMVLSEDTKVTFIGTTIILDQDDMNESDLEGIIAGDEEAMARYQADIKTYVDKNENTSDSEKFFDAAKRKFALEEQLLASKKLEKMQAIEEYKAQLLVQRSNDKESTEYHKLLLEEKLAEQKLAHKETLEMYRQAMEEQRKNMELQRAHMEKQRTEQNRTYEEARAQQQHAMEKQREAMELQREELEKQIERQQLGREKAMELQREELEKQLEKQIEHQQLAREKAMDLHHQALEEHEQAMNKHQESMEQQQEEIERRRAEHDEMTAHNNQFHELLSDQMYADGLIKKKRKYKFELSYDELKINNEVQDAELYKKYLKLYQEHYGLELKENSNVTIQRN